jgi:hypothetical protein
MGILNITVDDDLEERFRQKAAARFGNRKGNLSEAMKDALTEWVAKK